MSWIPARRSDIGFNPADPVGNPRQGPAADLRAKPRIAIGTKKIHVRLPDAEKQLFPTVLFGKPPAIQERHQHGGSLFEQGLQAVPGRRLDRSGLPRVGFIEDKIIAEIAACFFQDPFRL